MGNLTTDQDELRQVEVPLPEDHFRRLGIASRPTFYRWEQEGLSVLRVGGRRFIYASELCRFMEEKNSEARSMAARKGASGTESQKEIGHDNLHSLDD